MQKDGYDIGAAFAAIEEELTASMMRNMKRHRAEETKEGIQWSMWQAEQLKALERYKRENKKRYAGKFQSLNREIEELIRKARETGGMEQERAILNAIRNGFKAEKISPGMTAEFFKLNERKLEVLMEAVTHDMEKAETAVLRMSEDQYRKIIFNAQVYANTGAGTYEQAVDMASRDFLAAGLNCIQYANGARHMLSDYADMAIRTASKRAYLQGEGEKRQEWGISTVIMNKRGNPCPKCLPFVGKVLIDDVWSGGRKDGVDPETGKRYPLMSKAIEAGLYHPRCKDSHTTYFPGISTADDTWTKKELEAIGQNYAREQKEQYAKRQAEKYGRLAEHSLDEENQRRYAARREEWKKRHAVCNKENIKSEIHTIKSQIADIQEQMNDNIKQRLFDKGIQANIEGAGEYHKEAFEALKHLDKLTDEYRSTIASYTVGKTAHTQTEYGTAYTLNGKTAITVQPIAHRVNKAIDALGLGKKQPLGTTYHEFAHSLSQSREKVDPEFWKEIRKIKREYEGIRGKSNWFDVKISDYASKDVDEFLAEAFTQAKLSDTPSPYSKRVLDVVDKYFKKEIQNQKKYKIKAAEWAGQPEGEGRGVNIKKSYADFLSRLREDQSLDAHKSRMALYAESTQILEDNELPAPFAYIPDLDVIKYNPNAPYIGDYDMDYVFAHEISHRMDELEYHSWENEKFLQAIEICARKVYAQREKVQNWFEPGGQYEQSFAISDIISALTNGEMAGMVGHSEAYWSEIWLKAMELFADISAADILELPEKEELRGLLKELFKAYEEMVR